MHTRPAIARPSGLATALILGWFIAAFALGANLGEQPGSARETAPAVVAAGGVMQAGAEQELAAGAVAVESPALTIGVVAALLLIGGTLVLLRAGLGTVQSRLHGPRHRLHPRPVAVVVDRSAIARRRSVLRH